VGKLAAILIIPSSWGSQRAGYSPRTRTVCSHVNHTPADNNEPANFEEAMMSLDSRKWLEAMKSELGSMSKNQVWTLVDPPSDRKAVGSKRIFKKKMDADVNVTIYKARLVAKGFRQVQGVDYDENFSPVAMFKSIMILLAIVAFYDYEIWQMDVKTAFLNGNIDEESYMMQPEGFVNPKDVDKVCQLQCSIYGLKQASRSRDLHFDQVIKSLDLFQIATKIVSTRK
jgi:hypothetical protein